MQIPWDLIRETARRENVDPYLIAAIGVHETRWGELGAGRQGFHLGYGFPDSGVGDPRFQGLEAQVRGATWKMGQWGKRPGTVTLEGLQAGNQGLLPTGIYATDQNWPNAVFRIYNQLRQTSTSQPPTGGALQGQEFVLPGMLHRPALAAIGEGIPPLGVPRPSGWIASPAYFITILVISVAGVVALYKAIGGAGLGDQVIKKIGGKIKSE